MTQESLFTSHEKVIADINKVLEHIEKPPKPKISASQEYWQGQADKLALSLKISTCVVEIDRGHYQVWPLDKFGANNVYVSEYMGGGN